MIADYFKANMGKLYFVGLATWIAEANTVIGLAGAMIGVFAGVMLVCIRWQDFVASRPVQWLLRKMGR